MTRRNVHGDWTVKFENRILYNEGHGAGNKEGAVTWLEEVEEMVLSSPESDKTPWVILSDIRDWEGFSLDAWGSLDDIQEWMLAHNCVFIAVLVSTKLMEFATTTNAKVQKFTIYYDYDEAHQACLDKLAEAQSQHNQ
ncbi:hypothetical protein L4C34_18340 [Vibrio profundum]|uniref:hypothetical protein n=1 Tax=Vibrio profundum TaxID=2910247 RepID=UPI003D0BA4A5